ncbi:hypothetical protein FHU10_4824 [Serratia fonticola]|uniref:Uncharacterized protein n=1 Tax=Serratia fonticola TaxID=47917 RepID=A0A559TC05_SERFO|nr:hypothetical protein FHU09_2879 [Serratia fonticola]TQI97658.1 hypothetical protein FHU11_3164 [Serratia fonticola]TVZ72156.1 hypothetical protein FHU10_4824 [Serratia fonticola]
MLIIFLAECTRSFCANCKKARKVCAFLKACNTLLSMKLLRQKRNLQEELLMANIQQL